jgi:hypothetical protein
MKKAIIILLALAAASGLAFAQAAAPKTDVGTPDPNKIGVDTAQQKLKEVSIDEFEAAARASRMMMAFFMVGLPYLVPAEPQASLVALGSARSSPSKRVSKVSVRTLMLLK